MNAPAPTAGQAEAPDAQASGFVLAGEPPVLDTAESTYPAHDSANAADPKDSWHHAPEHDARAAAEAQAQALALAHALASAQALDKLAAATLDAADLANRGSSPFGASAVGK